MLTEKMSFFPLFISLSEKKVVIIGAGNIAARRTKVLLEFGAQVTVIAPETSAAIDVMEKMGSIGVVRRPFRPSDLEGADFCIAATNLRDVNHGIFLLCRESRIPVNVADCKEECDFYFPAIAKKGTLVAGISASGNDHRLAKKSAEEVRLLFDRFVREDGEYE